MTIPTEPIGSIPRPRALTEEVARRGGLIEDDMNRIVSSKVRRDVQRMDLASILDGRTRVGEPIGRGKGHRHSQDHRSERGPDLW